MCGICGIAQIGGPKRKLVDVDVLVRMTDVMTHRGPNDRGLHLAPGIALGVRRLSIVDVEGGHQPFDNEDGRVSAIQNGELYNHDAIRRDLSDRGHRFRSRCDTEILPHLYEEVGERAARQAAREVRPRGLGRTRRPNARRSRPSRRQAALLRR